MKIPFNFTIIFLALFLFQCKNSEKTVESATTYPTIQYPKVIVDEGFTLQKNKVPVTIQYMEIEGDLLTLEVSYNGGCEEHEFELISNGAYTKSYPPQLYLFLNHNDKNDRCRSTVDKTIKFDLKTVQYPGTGQIVLKFNNSKERIDYNY